MSAIFSRNQLGEGDCFACGMPKGGDDKLCEDCRPYVELLRKDGFRFQNRVNNAISFVNWENMTQNREERSGPP